MNTNKKNKKKSGNSTCFRLSVITPPSPPSTSTRSDRSGGLDEGKDGDTGGGVLHFMSERKVLYLHTTLRSTGKGAEAAVVGAATVHPLLLPFLLTPLAP